MVEHQERPGSPRTAPPGQGQQHPGQQHVEVAEIADQHGVVRHRPPAEQERRGPADQPGPAAGDSQCHGRQAPGAPQQVDPRGGGQAQRLDDLVDPLAVVGQPLQQDPDPGVRLDVIRPEGQPAHGPTVVGLA